MSILDQVKNAVDARESKAIDAVRKQFTELLMEKFPHVTIDPDDYSFTDEDGVWRYLDLEGPESVSDPDTLLKSWMDTNQSAIRLMTLLEAKELNFNMSKIERDAIAEGIYNA